MMPKAFQLGLLVAGIIGTLALGAMITLSLLATMHSSTPARVQQVTAGPYQLKVSLYADPANAGFALPFAIAPQQPLHGGLTYTVVSVPGQGVKATPVKASLSPDANVPGGVQGEAEIPVSGSWTLQIAVDGPQGHGSTIVPITATAPPAVPGWLGWLVGLLPFYTIIALLVIYWRRREQAQAALAGQTPEQAEAVYSQGEPVHVSVPGDETR